MLYNNYVSFFYALTEIVLNHEIPHSENVSVSIINKFHLGVDRAGRQTNFNFPTKQADKNATEATGIHVHQETRHNFTKK